MGITGSDVAKEVADMVITDDNFISITKAVREGRTIYDNIVKSIMYLVSCNFGELFLIVAAIALGYPVPLLPVHILWVNLVTDGLPALSLAFDPGTPTIMNNSSLVQKSILNKKTMPIVIEFGLLVGLIPLFLYILTFFLSGLDEARTSAFTAMVVIQMIVIFFLRPGQSFFSNKLLLAAISISLILQYLITSIPFLKTIFHIV
jgi:Ca2+-transporting ATPase